MASDYLATLNSLRSSRFVAALVSRTRARARKASRGRRSVNGESEMSGPKVVHIVTREEILDICRGQLARVEAAFAEWLRIGRRNACVDEEAITAVRNRRDALAALITANRFMDLQKEAPIEEAFLRDDIQARLAKVAAQQSAVHMRARRRRLSRSV